MIYYCFELHSLIINDVVHLFMCLLTIYVFFRKTSIQVFCLFFLDCVVCFFALNCMNSCIFWILTLCQRHHLQIFSPIPQIFFSFCFRFPLLCKNFLSLIRSHLFILLLLPQEANSTKYCYGLCQKVFCLYSLLGVLWFPF